MVSVARWEDKTGEWSSIDSSAQKRREKRKVGCKVGKQNGQGAQVAGGTFYWPKLSIREATNNGLPPSSRYKKAAGLRDGRRASEP